MGDENGSLLDSRLYMLSDSKGVFREYRRSCLFMEGSFPSKYILHNVLDNSTVTVALNIDFPCSIAFKGNQCVVIIHKG